MKLSSCILSNITIILIILTMIITSSKSVPKMPSETNERHAVKLPSIIPERNEVDYESEHANIMSTGNTKKLRSSRNQNLMKAFASENEQSSIIEKFRNPNLKRKSMLQNSVYRPSRSVRKEQSKSEMEEIYRTLNKLICLDYDALLNSNSASESVKGIIEKGNNSLLVRQILKSRGYWNIKGIVEEDDNSTSLIWSEFRQKNYTSSKPTRQFYQSAKKIQIAKSMKCSLMEFKNIFKLFILPHDQKEELTTSQMLDVIKQLLKKDKITLMQSKNLKLTNHLPQQQQLSNKKSLFQNLYTYYNSKSINPFENIPVTFHLASSTSDPEFQKFVQFAQSQNKKKNLWIIKPGEFTNRGNGITVQKGIQGVKSYLQSFKSKHTYLVQNYIKPYLYCQRKFDIRCYLLVTMMNNSIKGYWYQEGYIRTSSQPFSYKKMDKMIHLTNDAVQKYGQNYGKYEAGNKLSYAELQKYIQKNDQKDFMNTVVPKMRQLAKDSLFATKGKLGNDRSEQGFQIYGLDFMLDEDLKPWLIQFNTNPCLETGSSLLSRIIPQMLDNAFRICLDPFLLENNRKLMPGYQCFLRSNKFQLIYRD